MATVEQSFEVNLSSAPYQDAAAQLKENWRTEEALYTALTPEPVADEMSLSWVRETPFIDDDGDVRIRRTGIFREIINEKERLHLIRMSFADDKQVEPSQPTPFDVILPGWTEMIDAQDSTSFELHNELARQNSKSHTLSIATLGVSRHGPGISPSEALSRSGLVDHAASVRRIVGHLAEKEAPITIIPVSMGTVIAYNVAAQNLDAEEAERLNFELITPVVQCLVASEVPEEERFREGSDKVHSLRTTGNFFARLPISIGGEILEHPVGAVRKAIGTALIAEAGARNPKKGIAMIGNFINMLPGVPWELIKRVRSTHVVIEIDGLLDPMQQKQQREKLKELGLGSHNLGEKRRGHALPMDTKRTVELITQAKELARAA